MPMAKPKRTIVKQAMLGLPDPFAHLLIHPLRDKFLDAIAGYLVDDQAKKSIELQMGKDSAKEWAQVRSVSGVSGYATKDEALVIIRRVLGIT